MDTPCVAILHSGLCNQMFKVAAAYAHAKRNGYTLAIRVRHAGDRNLLAYLPQLKPYFIPSSTNSAVWNEPGFSYTTIPTEAQQLGGYYQSPRYFDEVRDEVCALFDPPQKEEISRRHVATLEGIKRGGIAVHVRRGDYLLHPQKHGILTMVYYEKAVATARERLGNPVAPLFVFSDDLPWCRAQPLFAGATFVDEPVDYIALYIMSQFQTIVIANSTFSWWAAYMGPRSKTVIAPDRWFGPLGPQDFNDIYLPSWIRVPIAENCANSVT
jgi:hypothetical protein